MSLLNNSFEFILKMLPDYIKDIVGFHDILQRLGVCMLTASR